MRRILIALAVACSFAAAIPTQAQIFMSPEDARKVGREEHPKILKEFGGVYDDLEIGAYVAGISGRIAGHSGQPAGNFTFTVLNSPIVNAALRSVDLRGQLVRVSDVLDDAQGGERARHVA